MVAAALPQSVANERRRALRRQPTLGTVCRLNLATGEQLIGLVWNMSATGLSMLVHRRIEKGTTLDIEVTTGEGGDRLACDFQIAHVAQMCTGDYIVGGQFSRCLNPAEMQPFLAPVSS